MGPRSGTVSKVPVAPPKGPIQLISRVDHPSSEIRRMTPWFSASTSPQVCVPSDRVPPRRHRQGPQQRRHRDRSEHHQCPRPSTRVKRLNRDPRRATRNEDHRAAPANKRSATRSTHLTCVPRSLRPRSRGVQRRKCTLGFPTARYVRLIRTFGPDVEWLWTAGWGSETSRSLNI